VKWRSPDRNISVGLNGYITKFKDMQTSTPGGISGVNGFSNFGDATTKGIDFEFRWRTPLEGLSLNAVGNVNDGKYDRVNPAVQAALPLFRPGSRIVNSINFNYRLDATYTGNITEDVVLFSNAGWSRTGDRLQSAVLTAQPYSQLGATLGLRYKQYDLALVGENLGDERGPTIVGNQGLMSGAGPTPRTISLRFRVNFQ